MQLQQEQFLIKGVIPSSVSPSSGLLNVECDITNIFSEKGSDYINWNQKLQDLINEKDAKYARVLLRLRGRGVDVKYRTYQASHPTGKTDDKGKPIVEKTKLRKRILTLMPYPSVFASRLSWIKQQFYESIYDVGAITLESHKVGPIYHKTYFLLEHQAAELKKLTNGYNGEIHKINQDVADFERTRDFREMIDYLKRDIPADRWSRRPPVHTVLHDIQLSFQPMPISKYIIESYTEASVREGVRKNIHEQVEKIAKSLNKTLSSWVQDLTTLLLKDLTAQDITNAEKKLQEIRSMATQYQMNNLVSRDLSVCETLMEAIKTKDAVMIDKATKQVAQLTGVNTLDKGTRTILREAAMTMVNVSDEAKNLIEAML